MIYINYDSFWCLFKWASRYDMINILWRPLRCQSGLFQPNLGWNMELGFLHMASWENLEFTEWLLISKIFVYCVLVLNFPIKHYCFRVCRTSTSGLHEMRLALAVLSSKKRRQGLQMWIVAASSMQRSIWSMPASSVLPSRPGPCD